MPTTSHHHLLFPTISHYFPLFPAISYYFQLFPAISRRSPAARPRPPGAFLVISYEKWHFGNKYLEGRFWLYFRIMSNPSQKAIYSSRNKSQMAPNEKVSFHEKLWLRSKRQVKVRFFIVEIKFLQKVWKKEDQCTSIFHFADRPEVPYEVDFWRNSFPKEIGFQKMWSFRRVILDVSKEIFASM